MQTITIVNPYLMIASSLGHTVLLDFLIANDDHAHAFNENRAMTIIRVSPNGNIEIINPIPANGATFRIFNDDG